ncbi:MAG: ligase-associated DNA damage response endonuclease PdeM [Pseudomonadota bacterium]
MNKARTLQAADQIALSDALFEAQPSGALWWPERQVLAVADLHLGKAERLAREGGALLPPYETTETLNRLDAEVNRLRPRLIIAVGDSFDDLSAASALSEEVVRRLERLAAGRRLIWISGNHDPGPVSLPGSHLDVAVIGGVHLRHIAKPDRPEMEISGHFHPKAHVTVKGRRISRRCFVVSGERVILPAFGTYTGGLDVTDKAMEDLLGPGCRVLLTGKKIISLSYAQLD